eukprot:scaffold630_cov218-Pinguiococcus_pyrenoidosus.AAC.2
MSNDAKKKSFRSAKFCSRTTLDWKHRGDDEVARLRGPARGPNGGDEGCSKREEDEEVAALADPAAETIDRAWVVSLLVLTKRGVSTSGSVVDFRLLLFVGRLQAPQLWVSLQMCRRQEDAHRLVHAPEAQPRPGNVGSFPSRPRIALFAPVLVTMRLPSQAQPQDPAATGPLLNLRCVATARMRRSLLSGWQARQEANSAAYTMSNRPQARPRPTPRLRSSSGAWSGMSKVGVVCTV